MGAADKRWIRLTLAATLSLAATAAYAAIEYSIADGLSQNSALALVRDDDGFVWIGTEDGLNRFDGYEFRVYHPADTPGTGAGAAYIRDLHADGSRIYMATEGGGLVVFDREHERFRSIGVADGLISDYLTSLESPRPGELWAGSRSGLMRLRWHGDPMHTPPQMDPLPIGREGNSAEIWSLQSGPSGVWIGTGNGLYRSDAEGRISALSVPGSTRPFNVDALLEMPAGVLWIGSWDQGLFRLDLASGQARRFLPGQSDTVGLRTRRVLQLAAGPDGTVFIGTDRGLVWYDPACDCIKALDSVRSARVAGRGFLVESLLVDEHGGLFAGYWGEGLVRFTPSDLVFHVERKRDEGPPGVAHNRVRAILEDRSGDLWVGSFGGGVQRVRGSERRDGVPWPFESIPFDAHSDDSAQLVWGLLQDRQGRVIAATDDGLYFADPAQPRWQRERPLGVAIPMAGTRTLLEDQLGRLWVGSSAGLSRTAAVGQHRQRIPLNPQGPSDPWYARQDENVYALYQDAAGRIWVGTWAGLHILDSEGTPLARYRVSDGLPGPIIWDIHRHVDGSLWLASNGGLARVLDPDAVTSLHFEPTGALNGLPGGTVYGLASDRQGLLWITGNRGLIRLDPQSGRFDIWRQRDGLASDEFATGAISSGSDGRLYFGGVNGLTAINPDRLRMPAELPRPALARVQLGDTAVRLQRVGLDVPRLHLPANHPPLILDFTGFTFDAPASARYAYRTHPALAFTDLGPRRSLSLDRLPVGAHQVELSVDNNGRSAARTLLAIDVAPPYYASWPFRIGLAVVTLAALLVLYGWRVRALTLARRRLEAEVAARTRELRNQKEALEATAEALATANIKLKTLSSRDPLTGLPNRRELIERIGEALADRGIQPRLALALIDLDHFKHINDEHGHLAGDAVLRDFATALQAHMRGEDSIGRWGGEEFLALLPGAGHEDARRWSELLLEQLRRRTVQLTDRTISYRASIGIALAAHGDDMDQLVARADRALYAAKAAGRDHAVIAAAADAPDARQADAHGA